MIYISQQKNKFCRYVNVVGIFNHRLIGNKFLVNNSPYMKLKKYYFYYKFIPLHKLEKKFIILDLFIKFIYLIFKDEPI